MMPKIKILLAITKGNWGGAQRYVYDLATNLPAAEFEIKVVTGQGGALDQKLTDRNVPVFSLNSLGRDIKPHSDLAAFWQIYKLIRRERPAVLHLNSPKMGLLGGLAGRLVGVKKIIYTSHGWPWQEDRPALIKLFFKSLCWLITKLAHHTIVISQAEQTNQKFKLIYNGISPIDFLPRAEAREKLGLSQNELVIGTIAELHKNKGLKYLLSILNLQFVIIGEGEERKELANKNLRLLGHVNNAAALLPALDIFILPSIKEGLPYVILEAGLAGLPVIATNVGGIPEVIIDNETGRLIPPKDSPALAAALEDLIKNLEIRKSLGANLQAKVQQEFNLERMVRETIKVYEA